jgi:hypothetical protein
MASISPGVTSRKPVMTNLPIALHLIFSHSRLGPSREMPAQAVGVG